MRDEINVSLKDSDHLGLVLEEDKANISLAEGEQLGLVLDNDEIDIQMHDDDILDVTLDNYVQGIGGTDDYEELINKPIHVGMTGEWNAQKGLIGKKDHIYVYTDYETLDGVDIPALKIGDGKAYLIDIPFADGNATALLDHVKNKIVHLTAEERAFWNNKVTCFLSQENAETVVFSKE